MNQEFLKKFKACLEESDDGEQAAFEKSLDKGTDPADFDTDGVSSLVDALCEELKTDVARIKKVVRYMVDMDNPRCLLKRVERVHKSIEFEKVFAPIEKAVEKATLALNEAITKMEVAITTAPAKRDKRKREDVVKQSGTTSPY